jgi:hypothetical protein
MERFKSGDLNQLDTDKNVTEKKLERAMGVEPTTFSLGS